MPIDEEHFPDENFRMMVEEFDSDNDGLISQDEISVVDVIDVSDRNIKSLEGIKYFFALGAYSVRKILWNHWISSIAFRLNICMWVRVFP